MSGTAAPATPDTSTNPAPAQGLATPDTTTPAAAPANPTPAPAASTTAQAPDLSYLPESYRENPAFNKYKSQDEFFKGVENLQKLVGQKQIVNGIQVPGENATPDEMNAFYSSLGRPESAEKYEFSKDIQLHEGLDLATEAKGISEIAFNLGLNKTQADGLMKAYAQMRNDLFQESETKVKETFDKALVTAFGTDFKESLALAKRGAKALGIADKLDQEGISSNPLVLKLCAELGKFTGEDSFENGKGDSNESLLEEAKRLMASPEYKSDPKTQARVTEIFQKVYPS